MGLVHEQLELFKQRTRIAFPILVADVLILRGLRRTGWKLFAVLPYFPDCMEAVALHEQSGHVRKTPNPCS